MHSVEPPVGFSINATTGAISKGNGAVSGPNQIICSSATTNTGVITVKENILTVVVGAPPTLQMVQQDGSNYTYKSSCFTYIQHTPLQTPLVDGMSPTAVGNLYFQNHLVNSEPDVSAWGNCN